MRTNHRFRKISEHPSSDMIFNILSLVPEAREKIIEINGRMLFWEREESDEKTQNVKNAGIPKTDGKYSSTDCNLSGVE